MKRHILDQKAPGLAARLRSLPPNHQRKLLAAGALFTAEKLGDLSKATSEVLDELRAERELWRGWAKFVLGLSEMADDRYLLLRQQGYPEDQWTRLFSEARLLRGIAVGFGVSPGDDIADAFYELIKAVDDPRETPRLIESELDGDPRLSCL